MLILRQIERKLIEYTKIAGLIIFQTLRMIFTEFMRTNQLIMNPFVKSQKKFTLDLPVAMFV